MSDTTYPELCSLIAYLCKPPKYFDFPEAEHLFRFFWFEEFPFYIGFHRFPWEDRTYCLPCVLFGHKNVGKYLQKNISKLANSNKNI